MAAPHHLGLGVAAPRPRGRADVEEGDDDDHSPLADAQLGEHDSADIDAVLAPELAAADGDLGEAVRLFHGSGVDVRIEEVGEGVALQATPDVVHRHGSVGCVGHKRGNAMAAVVQPLLQRLRHGSRVLPWPPPHR